MCLQPYRIAKDHRTKVEVGDVDKVLDGYLEPFLRGFLLMKRRGTAVASVGADDDLDVWAPTKQRRTLGMSSAETSALIDEMLHTAKTIAVIGISNKTGRASYNIGDYLAKHGYRVVPVNPALSEIAVNGKVLTSYPTLEDAQAALAVENAED